MQDSGQNKGGNGVQQPPLNIDALKEKFEATLEFHARYKEIMGRDDISSSDRKRVTEVYKRYNTGMITYFAELQKNEDPDVQKLFQKYNKNGVLLNVTAYPHITPKEVGRISDKTIAQDSKETLKRFTQAAEDKKTVQNLNAQYDMIGNYFKAYTIDVKELEQRLGIENKNPPGEFLHDIGQERKDAILGKIGIKVTELNKEKGTLEKSNPRVASIDEELEYLIKTRNVVSLVGLDKQFLEVGLKELKAFNKADYKEFLKIERDKRKPDNARASNE